MTLCCTGLIRSSSHGAVAISRCVSAGSGGVHRQELTEENTHMKRARHSLVLAAALVLGASISAPPLALAVPQSAQNDTNLQAEVTNKALNKPNLKGVHA